MQQQVTFDFPTPPLASVEKMMPHDARIREVYLTGKGIRATAKELGLGKSLVEHAVARMGIARSEAQARNTGIDWDKAVVLYRAGHGTKHIAKACGTTNHPSIREGLIKRGVYEPGRPTARGSETWAGYLEAEIYEHGRIEARHNNAWIAAYTKRITPLEYYYANHEKMKAKGAQYARKRYHATKHLPEAKAARAARRTLKRISESAKTKRKTGRTVEYLGCTFKEAADYIASMFRDGMTWDNHGVVWEIDHIIPLSAFDLMDDNQMRFACHYSNLQPLTVTENRTKPDGIYAFKQGKRTAQPPV